MFVRALEPRAYLEETNTDRISNLTNVHLPNLDSLDLAFPGPRFGHTLLPVCPANHLLGHTPLLTSPLASAWGRLLKGDKGAFHLSPYGSPNGQPLVPLGQV